MIKKLLSLLLIVLYFSLPLTAEDDNTAVLKEAVAREGNWLPELTSFFPTMLANPRIIAYSFGYQTYDQIFRTPLIPVSMGDRFTIYQFSEIPYGRLYLGIEAAVWAVFEGKYQSLALLNADYYVGIPVTYLYNNFSLRFRMYHQSSHLGDELLIERKHVRRLNPSMEGVDLFLAYDLTEDFTVFGCAGAVVRSDESYRLKPIYLEYGFNYYINACLIRLANLDASPYLGAYFTCWEDNHWQIGSTATIGYEWKKFYGRKMRIYLEGHNGFSNNGQFSKCRTRYVALKISYGY